MWCWRMFKRWLGGVRHGATYKHALELIAGHGLAMIGYEAEWARDLAKNTLEHHDPYHDRKPFPKLKQAFALYRSFKNARE